jgi:CheY-like chemotaxis protein
MSHAVLIVDDEARIYQALRRALHRESYDLLYAESGQQALEILGERAVDVVIADENMPGMQGSALLARVRQQWPDIVRMMLTGDPRLDVIISAVNKGEIYRFFTKPCNEAELIIAIRDGLQMRALKFEAARLLATVKKQSATIRTMSGNDILQDGNGGPATDDGADPPTIVLSASKSQGRTLSGGGQPSGGARRTDPGGGKDGHGGVFRLDRNDVPDDVDALLDEIRDELEKLDF